MVLDAFFSLKSDSDKLLIRYLKDYFKFSPYHLQLYRQALLHKSMTQNKSAGVRHSNERLEFLGDAVIDAIVGDYLYHAYPNENEGFLTKARSKLVSRKHLNQLAISTGLHTMLVSDVKNKSAMENLAGNAFEALIGAIYLRKGYNFVEKRLIELIKRFTHIEEYIEVDEDFKTQIYQWVQKNKKKLIFEAKEIEHKKSFEVDLLIDGELIASGTDKNIKLAEQSASKKALEKLEINKR